MCINVASSLNVKTNRTGDGSLALQNLQSSRGPDSPLCKVTLSGCKEAEYEPQ